MDSKHIENKWLGSILFENLNGQVLYILKLKSFGQTSYISNEKQNKWT